MKKLLMVIFAGVLSLTFLGCREATIQNYNNIPIEDIVNKNVSITEIEKSILRAGTRLGWIMKKINNGQIQGKFILKKHEANVIIKYSLRDYSISYFDSSNLDYNSNENTIHQNYNVWVKNLNNAISLQLNTLE